MVHNHKHLSTGLYLCGQLSTLQVAECAAGQPVRMLGTLTSITPYWRKLQSLQSGSERAASRGSALHTYVANQTAADRQLLQRVVDGLFCNLAGVSFGHSLSPDHHAVAIAVPNFTANSWASGKSFHGIGLLA